MAITQAKVLAVVNLALRDGPPTEMEKLSLLEFKEELLQAFRSENEDAKRQQLTEKPQEPVEFQEEEEAQPEEKKEGEEKQTAAIHKHGFNSPQAQALREQRKKTRG
jgi:hypothetical protein